MKSHGFVVNPYVRCIKNSTIEDKQYTIEWYVDDKKLSHIDEEVTTQVIEIIDECFLKHTVSRGNKHEFLGMYIEFLSNGKLFLSVKDYIEELIDLFGE